MGERSEEESTRETIVQRVLQLFDRFKNRTFSEQMNEHITFIGSILPTDNTREQAYAEIREAYRKIAKQGGERASCTRSLIKT